MIVDDFNYLPYDKENYYRIFFDDTGEVDENGEKVYGAYNIFNSNPNELSEFQISWIVSKLLLQEYTISKYEKPLLPIVPSAREYLLRYIFNLYTPGSARLN